MVLERFACDYFLKALRNEEIARQVSLSRPKTMTEALQTALQVESVLNSRRSDAKTIRVARVDEEAEIDNTSAVKLKDVMQAIQKDIRQILLQNKRRSCVTIVISRDN